MMLNSFNDSHTKTKLTTCSPQFYEDISQLYSKIYKCREKRLRLLKDYSSLLYPDCRRSLLDSEPDPTIRAHQRRIDDLARRFAQCEQRLRELKMELIGNPGIVDNMWRPETLLEFSDFEKPDHGINYQSDRMETISKTMDRWKQEMMHTEHGRMANTNQGSVKHCEINSPLKISEVHCDSSGSKREYTVPATSEINHNVSDIASPVQRPKFLIDKSYKEPAACFATERSMSVNSNCTSILQDKPQTPALVICGEHSNTSWNGNSNPNDGIKLAEPEVMIPVTVKTPAQLKIIKLDTHLHGSPSKKIGDSRSDSSSLAVADEQLPSPKPRIHLTVNQQPTDSSSCSIESPIPPPTRGRPAMNYEAFLRQAAPAEFSDGIQSDEREIELGEALLAPRETAAVPQNTAEPAGQIPKTTALFKPNLFEDDDEDDSFYN